MKLKLASPFLETFTIQRLHTFDEKPLHVTRAVTLDPGFEYLITGTSAEQKVSIDPVLIGPAEGRAECQPSFRHRRIMKTRFLVKIENGKPPGTVAFDLHGPWLHHRTLFPGEKLEEKRGGGLFELPYVNLLGQIRIETFAGPYFIRGGRAWPSPDEGVLELSLPELETFKVEDTEGKPIEGAEIYLVPDGGKSWKEFPLRSSPWYFGATDGKGRIALPRMNFEGGRVLLLAWGRKPAMHVLDPKGQPATLEKDSIQRIPSPLEPKGRRVFANFSQSPGQPSSHPRFEKNRFLVPKALFEAGELALKFLRPPSFNKKEYPTYFLSRKIKSGFYVTKLDFWSPDGSWFRLGPKVKIERHKRVYQIPKDSPGGAFSVLCFDGEGINRPFGPDAPHALAVTLPLLPNSEGKLVVPEPIDPWLSFFGPSFVPIVRSHHFKSKTESFHAISGLPTVLSLKGAEPGIEVEFMVFGGEGETEGETWSLVGSSGIGLPDRQGRFALGLPQGSRCEVLVHIPGMAPILRRLSPGKHHILPSPAKSAWLLLEHDGKGKKGFPTRIRLRKGRDEKMSASTFAAFFGSKPAGRKITGLATPIFLVGPLPEGTYEFRYRRGSNPILIELREGKILHRGL